MTRVGTHCLVELLDCPPSLLDDEGLIRRALTEAALEARSELLQLVTQRFEPQGVTGLALLAESHLSIHTWPESGYAAVDAFTCGDVAIPEAACRHMARLLHARSATMNRTPRGAHVQHRLEPFRLEAVIETAPATRSRESETEGEPGELCRELKFEPIFG